MTGGWFRSPSLRSYYPSVVIAHIARMLAPRPFLRSAPDSANGVPAMSSEPLFHAVFGDADGLVPGTGRGIGPETAMSGNRGVPTHVGGNLCSPAGDAVAFGTSAGRVGAIDEFTAD